MRVIWLSRVETGWTLAVASNGRLGAVVEG